MILGFLVSVLILEGLLLVISSFTYSLANILKVVYALLGILWINRYSYTFLNWYLLEGYFDNIQIAPEFIFLYASK